VIRHGLDVALAWLARLVVRLGTRSIEVRHQERFPTGVPVLVVANHFNGLVDSVVLTSVLRRLPRFLAKSTLWKVWPIRPLLALAGLIPVYRTVDGGTPEQNQRMFAAAETQLRAGGLVGIFPEGTTHDAPQLAELRTGAARIALGSFARGAKRLAIAPVSLVYEDKLALRSRVLVRFGRAIDVDTAMTSLPGDDREAVRALTALIDERLTEVVPDFADVWQHAELSAAAAITLRSAEKRGDVPLGRKQELAEQLVHSDESANVRRALQRYVARLHIVDAADEEIAPRWMLGTLLGRLIWLGLLVGLAILLLAPALAFTLIPVVLVALSGVQPRAPVSKGTVRLLVGLIAFPATWITVAILVVDTWPARLGWIVYQAAASVFAIPLLDAVIKWFRGVRTWWHLRDRRGLVPDLLVAREDVVQAVRAATEPASATGTVGARAPTSTPSPPA
jgi:1-acyl-sn-glycerol-3-phosphate acyltransferase